MQAILTTHNTLPCVRFTHEGATALVALHGAHVLSWVPADNRERLFLSERARFDGRSAIRGGVPVIFPQFSERGIGMRHGFARVLPWRFIGVENEHAAFELRNDERTAQWPHAFIARLLVGLSATALELTLEVENTGDSAFDFTAALHTYLRVDALEDAAVTGLQGCDCEDSAGGGMLRREDNYEVRFDGEIDRIYNDVVAPLTLADGTGELSIEQEGFADAVVWNPGAALAATIGDLAPDDYRRFVCIEAATVLQPQLLAPGERWSGTQRLCAIS
jgi:glucose-6-phosphate 1-epimerase